MYIRYGKELPQMGFPMNMESHLTHEIALLYVDLIIYIA